MCADRVGVHNDKDLVCICCAAMFNIIFCDDVEKGASSPGRGPPIQIKGFGTATSALGAEIYTSRLHSQSPVINE